MSFKEIDITKENLNPFSKIGKDWLLITSGDEKGYNTMTASWGGVGVMWNKNVATIVVRPQRYTMKFLEENDCFTISFFGDEYKDALKYCGAHSGKDVDKAKETGLTPLFTDGTASFEQAEMILVCKKLYRQELKEDCFIDKSLLSSYKASDYHIAFVGEIVKAYKK